MREHWQSGCVAARPRDRNAPGEILRKLPFIASHVLVACPLGLEATRMAVPEVVRRKRAKVALAIFTTLCLLSGASAQSTDPDHPAPLGPGINRGNVDNSGRGHTFFFFAGPGHIDVDMAFEEMGLFGSPLRQAMNFDFYTDADTECRPLERRRAPDLDLIIAAEPRDHHERAGSPQPTMPDEPCRPCGESWRAKT